MNNVTEIEQIKLGDVETFLESDKWDENTLLVLIPLLPKNHQLADTQLSIKQQFKISCTSSISYKIWIAFHHAFNDSFLKKSVMASLLSAKSRHLLYGQKAKVDWENDRSKQANGLNNGDQYAELIQKYLILDTGNSIAQDYRDQLYISQFLSSVGIDHITAALNKFPENEKSGALASIARHQSLRGVTVVSKPKRGKFQ